MMSPEINDFCAVLSLFYAGGCGRGEFPLERGPLPHPADIANGSRQSRILHLRRSQKARPGILLIRAKAHAKAPSRKEGFWRKESNATSHRSPWRASFLQIPAPLCTAAFQRARAGRTAALKTETKNCSSATQPERPPFIASGRQNESLFRGIGRSETDKSIRGRWVRAG